MIFLANFAVIFLGKEFRKVLTQELSRECSKTRKTGLFFGSYHHVAKFYNKTYRFEQSFNHLLGALASKKIFLDDPKFLRGSSTYSRGSKVCLGESRLCLRRSRIYSKGSKVYLRGKRLCLKGAGVSLLFDSKYSVSMIKQSMPNRKQTVH